MLIYIIYTICMNEYTARYAMAASIISMTVYIIGLVMLNVTGFLPSGYLQNEHVMSVFTVVIIIMGCVAMIYPVRNLYMEFAR